jgi:hypothetical protein
MVASAVLDDQYQKPDQPTPKRTTIAVGRTISHRRQVGGSSEVG